MSEKYLATFDVRIDMRREDESGLSLRLPMGIQCEGILGMKLSKLHGHATLYVKYTGVAYNATEALRQAFEKFLGDQPDELAENEQRKMYNDDCIVPRTVRWKEVVFDYSYMPDDYKELFEQIIDAKRNKTHQEKIMMPQ